MMSTLRSVITIMFSSSLLSIVVLLAGVWTSTGVYSQAVAGQDTSNSPASITTLTQCRKPISLTYSPLKPYHYNAVLIQQGYLERYSEQTRTIQRLLTSGPIKPLFTRVTTHFVTFNETDGGNPFPVKPQHLLPVRSSMVYPTSLFKVDFKARTGCDWTLRPDAMVMLTDLIDLADHAQLHIRMWLPYYATSLSETLKQRSSNVEIIPYAQDNLRIDTGVEGAFIDE